MVTGSSFKGKVVLVGAGPGDPNLITVRGRDVLQRADTIVFDHLVAKELVDLAPAGAKRIYVGKKAGKHTLNQDGINELLVKEAQAGNAVVRLKGGDPFIFGRGAEECEYLRDHGVEFEVVPGISAVAAVPAYAGIPVTCRNLSTAFVAVTGHEDASKSEPDVDWAAIAQVKGTIVVFMGVLSVRRITDELMKHGKSPKTAAAVIRWGTYAHQRTVTGTVETIADDVKRAGLRPPGLIVIGEVVRLRERLDWFETRPLFGRTIVVPRARSQRSRLAALLIDKGANVLEIPAASHEPVKAEDWLSEVARNVNGYDWIVFPGVTAVQAFFEALNGQGQDSRSLAGIRIAALGEDTGDALIERGIRPDLIPSRFCPATVVEELTAHYPLEGMRVLYPYGCGTPGGLASALKGARAIVDKVAVSSGPGEAPEGNVLNGHRIDSVVFTCSSTVKSFFNRLGEEEARHVAEHAVLASIGPQTTRTLQEYRFQSHIQPKQSDLPSLADAILAYYANDADKD